MADAALVGAVSQNSNSASATTIAVSRSGILPGSCIVVFVSWDTAGGTSAPTVDDGTISDSTPDATVDASALLSQDLAVYVIPNHPGGTKTFTATFGTARTWRGIYVFEVQNADLASAYDGSTQAQSTSATASSGNKTPSRDGAYLFGATITSPAINSATAPFTLLHNDVVLTAAFSGLAQNPAAAIGASFTLAASGGWACIVLSIKPALAVAAPQGNPKMAIQQRAA